MFWVAVIIVVALVAVGLESVPGKIVAGASVLAMGLLLLRWITGAAVFAVLVKACAVVIVVAIVGTILSAIIG